MEISDRAQNISVQNLKDIKEAAIKVYTSGSIDPSHVDLFLAKCYTEAVLGLLSQEGYELTKKQTKESK